MHLLEVEGRTAVRCHTDGCGWARRLTKCLVKSDDGGSDVLWYPWRAAVAAHHRYHPDHLMGSCEKVEEGDPFLTNIELAVGDAYLAGFERGRDRMKATAVEVVGGL